MGNCRAALSAVIALFINELLGSASIDTVFHMLFSLPPALHLHRLDFEMCRRDDGGAERWSRYASAHGQLC